MITTPHQAMNRPEHRSTGLDHESTPQREEDALIVLDAHGVVFNRAFPTFVDRRARERNDDPSATWERGRRHLRLDFWEGRTTPEEMWDRLFPGDDPARLSAGLERTYRPGPLYEHVTSTSHRMWLLSNHHSGWLVPQLRRFGLADRFDRVLVSDQVGIAKPSPLVFDMIRRDAGDLPVVLFDDSAVNVAAARAAGLTARRVVDPASPRSRPRSRRKQ
jgi:HAD superfamily hydrolase (TIGR01509 family)